MPFSETWLDIEFIAVRDIWVWILKNNKRPDYQTMPGLVQQKCGEANINTQLRTVNAMISFCHSLPFPAMKDEALTFPVRKEKLIESLKSFTVEDMREKRQIHTSKRNARAACNRSKKTAHEQNSFASASTLVSRRQQNRPTTETTTDSGSGSGSANKERADRPNTNTSTRSDNNEKEHTANTHELGYGMNPKAHFCCGPEAGSTNLFPNRRAPNDQNGALKGQDVFVGRNMLDSSDPDSTDEFKATASRMYYSKIIIIKKL